MLIAASSLLLNQILYAVCTQYESVRQDIERTIAEGLEYASAAHNTPHAAVMIPLLSLPATWIRYQQLLKMSPFLLDAALQPRHSMVLVSLEDFKAQGRLRRFEELRDAGKLLYLDKGEDVLALRKRALILFFSHQ